VEKIIHKRNDISSKTCVISFFKAIMKESAKNEDLSTNKLGKENIRILFNILIVKLDFIIKLLMTIQKVVSLC
jgi:hypothetical protein